MKKMTMILFVILASKSFAWDFGFKADAQHASTDNVNLTNTNPTSDTYNTFGGYIQTKSDHVKIKLKGKVEKYKTDNANDNYSTDLSLQYKPDKENEFVASFFKQVYNGASLISTDTTSDNNGGKLSATFSKDFDKNSNGYFSPLGSYKKYPKLSNRTDKILGATMGLEYYFSSQLMVNPEINVQNDSSTNSYYSNLAYGPSRLISFTPNDLWEFDLSGSYSYSRYSGRTFTTISKGRPSKNTQHQELISIDFATIFNVTKVVSVQGKYSLGTNSSNYVLDPNNTTLSDPSYKAKVVSVDLIIKI